MCYNHGESWREIRRQEKAGIYSGKLTPKLLHALLIILGEGLRPEIIDTSASLIDLAPTIPDLLEIEKPESYQGKSLLRKRQLEEVIVQ